MNTPHPQADLLRAIADGKQMQMQILNDSWQDCCAEDALYHMTSRCYYKCLRVKPETVTINGIECPAPMRKAPALDSVYYCPEISRKDGFNAWRWYGSATDEYLLASGICFSTSDDAAAATKAMLAPLKGGVS